MPRNKRTKRNKDADWVWASPYSAGERPLNLNGMQHDHIVPAARKAGLDTFGWHCTRTSPPQPTSTAAAMDPSMREANDKVVKMMIQ